MRLTTRVREMKLGELAEVQRRLSEVQESIDACARAQQAHFSGGEERDLFGDRKATPAGAGGSEAASWNLRAVGQTWTPVRDAIQAWLDHGEATFFPGIYAWDAGRPDALEELQAALEVRQKLSGSYFERVARLRSTTAFVGPLKRPVAALASAMDAAQRVDDVELAPSILSGQRETSNQATGRSADRYRTSTDVVRSLRKSTPPEGDDDDDTPPEGGGFFQKLRSLFGG